MRPLLVILGVVSIGAYAVLGAFLMTDWVLVAASEVPLETTITQMRAANQPYSAVPGIIFAVLGGALALTWGVLTLRPRNRLPNWAGVSLWAGILAMGAPAYFFLEFGNMNSIGDTFDNWNTRAAAALEVPLYLISGSAVLIAIAAIVTAVIRATGSGKPVDNNSAR